MARSDIASVLKAIPARVFAENIDPTASTPPGFSSWGEWMIDTGGLDRGRWKAGNGGSGVSGPGIEPLGNVTTQGGQSQTGGCGHIIQLDTTTGNLVFDPNQISGVGGGGGNGGTFCKALKESYPSGSNRVIPLATTGAVKF